jgi:hypothetical protein
MENMYVAKLISISSINELTPEFKYSVEFKALVEGRELKGDEKVIIFNIENTYNYFPIFLDIDKDVEDIEKEVLEGACAKINYDAKLAISRFQRIRRLKSSHERISDKSAAWAAVGESS